MVRSWFMLCLLAWVSIQVSSAQQNDFATWNYGNFTFKKSENISFTFSEHMLRNENATEPWLFIHDISMNQWLNRHVSQEVHLRVVNQKQWNDVFGERFLAYYAMNGHLKLGDFQLSGRTRWQIMSYGSHFNDAYKGPYIYHRAKIALGKSVNYHWKWSLSSEFFQPINRPNRKGIDQIRYGVMITNTINKRFSVDHFFQIQQQKNRLNPYRYFVYGIGCNFAW